MGGVPTVAESYPSRPSLAKRVRLPRLSGKVSAAWLVLCFLLTAVLIPMSFRLPHWIEFEIVLAVWWTIWFAVLTCLLFKGQQVTDDHQLKEPRNWFASDQPRPRQKDSAGWWDGFWWGSTVGDGEGILVALGFLVALVLLIGVIWVLIEVAIPVLLFFLYFVTRGMLARVVNDRHHCTGRLGRALAWGICWATVYTLPLAGVVWFIHHVHRSQGG